MSEREAFTTAYTIKSAPKITVHAFSSLIFLAVVFNAKRGFVLVQAVSSLALNKNSSENVLIYFNQSADPCVPTPIFLFL